MWTETLLYVDCMHMFSYVQTKFSLVWDLFMLTQLTLIACMCSASYGIANPMCTLLLTSSKAGQHPSIKYMHE